LSEQESHGSDSVDEGWVEIGEGMEVSVYYNENDPKTAAWLRALIAANLIPEGEVDERSIAEIKPGEIAGYDQVHLFAGISGWSFALQLAGWPTDRPVWTGSCPCQPFSAAGKGGGEKDSRHLWPEMRRLIAECQPPICFGEQVASKAGRGWLNGVRLDLEAMGYAVGAADLCAAGVNAPHIRQRLFWVANSGHVEPRTRYVRTGAVDAAKRSESCQHIATGSMDGGLGDAAIESRERDARSVPGTQTPVDGERFAVDGDLPIGSQHAGPGVGSCGMENAKHGGRERRNKKRAGSNPTLSSGPWDQFELIPCRDGKARRIEPGLEPLAHGIPGRVAQLRGLGNAICPQIAAEFIKAFMETEQ
jgi:DNA (cytosine-5)-methyltransferase 1